jgi:hypothetical protein
LHVVYLFNIFFNHFGGVMVSVLTSVVLDRKFQTRLGQTKDYDIGTWCFYVKREALRFKSKDWLAFNLLTDCSFSDLAL